MPPQYFLDTNIVSYLLKGHEPALRTRFNLVTAERIAISSITEAEVFYGLALKPGAVRLRFAAEVFFASITCLAWDSPVARAYGLLRAEQERKGRPLSTENLMIAAHALSLGLTLVTHDQAFSFVEGLKTEDWTVT
ncbi:MAG: type II toxin-antitoxin system VapC family toxin [Terracidiphilus sp.]|jgi:tRNA(fMet)-specific endonuclease VapC